jgi:hypothetical protein
MQLIKIVGVVVFVILLLIIVGGGFHHYSFCRYVPTAPAMISSESDFQLSIYPSFVDNGSSGSEVVIPLLYYKHLEPTETTQIVVESRPLSSEYGYNGKTKLVLESITVESELGEIANLIKPPNTRVYEILDSSLNHKMHSLGYAEGNVLSIIASGHVLEQRGTKLKFNQRQQWRVTHSTRFGLGIFFIE